jgi:hypothetical protein
MTIGSQQLSRRCLATIAVFALVASACGGDDDAASATSATTAATPSVSGEIVVFAAA